EHIGLACAMTPTWHPIRLAEDLAILDHLTRGRLQVGFGRGVFHRDTMPFHLKADPRDEDTNRELTGEVIDIVIKSWTQEFFSHEGPNYTFPPPGIPHHSWSPTEEPYVKEDGTITKLCVLPKPYQKPHPPIWVMVSSEKSAVRAAEQGYNCIVAGTAIHIIRDWLQTYAEIRSERDGKTYKPGENWAIQRPICVAPTMEEARKDFEHYIWLQREYQALYRGDKAKEYTKYTLGGAEEWTWEVLLERAMIAGSPDDVGEKLQEIQDVGIDYLICWTDVGGFPHEKAMRTLELFGAQVMPLFKNGAHEEKAAQMTGAEEHSQPQSPTP
ncbi:MAG: LLM class flavin-dependent oxidoreductase, partial [Chloroflexi bacterium]|nr:LLM class flavin-dependent oxidoreductase [Chloroflexota bacterium]